MWHSSLENKERFHALVANYSRYPSFIIYSGSYMNMSSMHYSFSALHPYSGLSIRMGDDSKIQAKGIGKIGLEDVNSNNVLFVPDMEVDLLSMY